MISTAPGSALILITGPASRRVRRLHCHLSVRGESTVTLGVRRVSREPMRAVTFQAPGEVRVDEVPDAELGSPPTRRSSGSRRAASAARTSTSTTAASRSSRASSSATSTSAPSSRSATTYTRRAGRPRLGCLRHRLRRVLLLSPRRLPQVRPRAGLRPRQDARRRCRARRRSCCSSRNADLTLRKVPEGMSDDVALFAGDVMGTGYHAVVECGSARRLVAVLGLGPVGLCAVQAALAEGAAAVVAIDTVAERLELAGRSARRRSTSPRGTRARRSRSSPRAAGPTRRSTPSATPTRSSSPAG